MSKLNFDTFDRIESLTNNLLEDEAHELSYEDTVKKLDEICSYLYDTFVDYEEITKEDIESYMDVTQSEIEAVLAKFEEIKNKNIPKYNGMIELSDNHTIYELGDAISEKFGDLDDNDSQLVMDIWSTKLETAIDSFQEATGVEMFQDGRSGRHIVVEDNYENANNYEELQKVQREMEERAIEETVEAYGNEVGIEETDDITTPSPIENGEPIARGEEGINERDLSDYYKGRDVVETGLTGQLNRDILASVDGQLSDGMWEESRIMRKYWKYGDADLRGNDVVIYVDRNNYASGFRSKSDDEVRKFYATKIKQIVKEEGLEWSRSNEEKTSYIGYNLPVTVMDCYKAYDKLLGRKDYFTKNDDSDKALTESEEEYSFDEIELMMSDADSYSELYSAIDLIMDASIRERMIELVTTCEDDGDTVDEAYSISTSDCLDMYRNEENVANVSENQIKEEQKEYRYITTHGTGPGTLPKDVELIKDEDLGSGKVAIYLSRPLTDEELKKYDIKPEWIQESDEFKTFREYAGKKGIFSYCDYLYGQEPKSKYDELMIQYMDMKDEIVDFVKDSKEHGDYAQENSKDLAKAEEMSMKADEILAQAEAIPEEERGENYQAYLEIDRANDDEWAQSRGYNNIDDYMQNGMFESEKEYTPEQEEAIKRLMKKTGLSREEVLKICDEFAKLTGPSKSVKESDEDIVNKLVGEEKDAVESYTKAAEEVDSEDKKELFNHIKDEEKEHIEELKDNKITESSEELIDETTEDTVRELMDRIHEVEYKIKNEIVDEIISINAAIESLNETVYHKVDTIDKDDFLTDACKPLNDTFSDLNYIIKMSDYEKESPEEMDESEEPSKNKKKRKAVDIDWATDGEDIDLPNEIEIPDDVEDDEEAISDYVTNTTGFCHNRFTIVNEEESTKKFFEPLEFDKTIPYNMRFKDFDFVGGMLYWVTQAQFTKDDLKQFAEALKAEGISKAAITIRDLSKYDYDTDAERGVLSYVENGDVVSISDKYQEWYNERF